MANYPFRINIKSVDGTRYQGWYTASLATDSDSQISASAMVDKINAMPSASYEDGVATPSGTTADLFGGPRNLFLSCSVTDPNVGAIDFNDTESTVGGGLEYYTFWGSKVCSVLGLPEGIPIYTENFKLSDDSDDPDNYISGDMIADGLAIKESIKLSSQARVRSNLVWDEEFGEGLAQWVSGSSGRLLIGYDNVADKYKITADSSVTFDIEGVDNITAGELDGNVNVTSGYIRGGTLNLLSNNRTSFDITDNEAQLQVTNNNRSAMRGHLHLRHNDSSTWSNSLMTTDYTLALTNRHGDATGDFAGIAFDVGSTDGGNTSEDTIFSQAISAGIIAERDSSANGSTSNYDTNLSFATNDAGVSGLTKRMTITHDGLVGINDTDPGATLDVNGTTRFGGSSQSSTSHQFKAVSGNTNNFILFDSQGGDHFKTTGDASGGNLVIQIGDYPGGGNETFFKIDDNNSLFTFTNGDIALTATKKLYFDGGTHTYIEQTSDDELAFVVGGQRLLTMDEDNDRSIFYENIYIQGALPTDNTLDAQSLRLHNNDSNSFIDYRGGALYIRDDGTTAMTFDTSRNVTIANDLFVNDYARIDALRVGTTSTDPGDGNLYVEGDVTLGGAQPKLILDSLSTGDNWTSQGAQISLGESGDGNASLHLTYTGDGYGRIGMGTITSGVPAFSVIKFYYAASRVEIPDADVEIHNALSVGHTGTPSAPLDVRKTQSDGNYIGIFRNTSSTDSGNSYILNLWHSQEDSTADFDSTEVFVNFSDNSGTILGAIHSEVTYGTFTGAHVSQIISGSALDNENEIKTWKPGMIVKSTGNLNVTGSSMGLAWPEVTIVTEQKDKAVMGVFSSVAPGSGSNWINPWNGKSAVSSSTGDWGEGHNMHGLDAVKPNVHYNSVGEGMMLVTDTNGNIETGDYICSSNRAGHGEKQDDDLLHNYTVAKATQPMDFSTISVDSDLGYKSVLIACTYHCG